MSSIVDTSRCNRIDDVCAYALHALPAAEAGLLEAHLSECEVCRQELESLQPVLDALPAWPTDVLRPPPSLQRRLAERLAQETGGEPLLPSSTTWAEPEWEQVAPGISCKLLANDAERRRVSMLVRLAPGAAYPPHTHAGVEELFLLDGELWIQERKLRPGDYSRAEPGTGDTLVWSETGCTCVLVTSTDDILA